MLGGACRCQQQPRLMQLQASPSPRPRPRPHPPVRTRPMPWAPFLRATRASAGVSAGAHRVKTFVNNTPPLESRCLRATEDCRCASDALSQPASQPPACMHPPTPAFAHTPILRKESTVVMNPARSPVGRAGRQQAGAAGLVIRQDKAGLDGSVLMSGPSTGACLAAPAMLPPRCAPSHCSPSPFLHTHRSARGA